MRTQPTFSFAANSQQASSTGRWCAKTSTLSEKGVRLSLVHPLFHNKFG
jgi:hypothetical protein